MKSLGAHKPLKGSTHLIPKAHKLLKATSPREMITVTLIVRRRKGGSKLREVKDFSARANAVHEPVSRERFIANHVGQLFQDAANLFITVLVSSGDSGCFLGGNAAQASYPATEPMAIACGGTTVGNVSGSTFDEFAWNDVGAGGPGASGGGISAMFPVPSYQNGAGVPKHNSTHRAGRGIPDLAGNASENSGYMQVAAGTQTQPVGGTSAVAPLYAGLFARINSNLGVSVGFVNQILYSLGKTAFRDTVAPPGPKNNSFNGVTSYPVEKGWDACTGWGSVQGVALQNGLKAANAGSKLST